MFKKKKEGPKSELKSAEEKFQSLIEKRNELNDKARELREERDSLQEKRKELVEERKKVEETRNELNEKTKVFRKRRNELQARAKALIALKQNARKGQHLGIDKEMERLKSELRIAKMRQETAPMNLTEENALVKKIKEMTAELARLEKVAEEQDEISKDISNLDANIDELFKLADEEHQQVVEY
ncbi:MAG TPA: hypothetical protein ENN76_03590, partial [Euryarchaeota archaeon]|nr:hypothetical protein [Euryarchaeota archaeon]